MPKVTAQQRMMIDANGVYLRRSDETKGTLIRVPLDGSGSVVDVTTDLVLAYEVTDDTIYWATLVGIGTLVLSRCRNTRRDQGDQLSS